MIHFHCNILSKHHHHLYKEPKEIKPKEINIEKIKKNENAVPPPFMSPAATIKVFLYFFMGGMFWLFIVWLSCYICMFYFLYVILLFMPLDSLCFCVGFDFVTPSL
jgi:hypothetical protein